MRRAVLPSLPWVYVFFLSFLESLPRRGAAAAGLLCGLQPSERRDSTVPPSSLKEERGRRGGPHSPTQEGPPGRCSVLCIARRVPWNPGWLSFPFYQKPSVPRAGQTSRILGRAARRRGGYAARSNGVHLARRGGEHVRRYPSCPLPFIATAAQRTPLSHTHVRHPSRRGVASRLRRMCEALAASPQAYRGAARAVAGKRAACSSGAVPGREARP